MNQIQILMIEDSSADAKLLSTALRRVGFEGVIDHFTTAEAGLEFLREAEAIHLVLLDLNLPGMSGLELLEIVKSDKKLRRHPVAVLSTSDAPRDVERALDLHANAYFQKPGEFSEILELAKALLGLWARRALTAPIS